MKIELKKKETETTQIEYNGSFITVKDYLPVPNQISIINGYVERYFSETPGLITKSHSNILEAEYFLLLNVLEEMTDIDIDTTDMEVYEDDGLMDKIFSHIKNYWSFKDKLYTIVEQMREEIRIENSVGVIIKELGEKLTKAIGDLSSISPEEIEKLSKTGEGLMKKLEKNSLLNEPQTRGKKAR